MLVSLPYVISAMIQAAGSPKPPIAIDAILPGGNVVLQEIEGDRVRISQDLRDTEGWWFFWRFSVKGAAGRTLTFDFGEKSPIGVLGPAVSKDRGASWQWLGAECVDGATFAHEFSKDADEVWFSFNVPYQPSHLEGFLVRHQGSPHLDVLSLCRTRKGREVPEVRVGCLSGNASHRILLTARHHACESMANYVMEGVLEAALSPGEDGDWFREHVEILAIPFMDLDGVIDGDQGKNRRPYDHNRDYGETSIYPSVAALRKLVPVWSEGRLRVALDLHCPYIRGGGDKRGSNERIYFVGGPCQDNWREIGLLSSILERERKGPLPYESRHNLPFGESWNASKDAATSSRWTASLEGVDVGATMEIPYALVADTIVTPGACRQFGKDLARALRLYILETWEGEKSE